MGAGKDEYTKCVQRERHESIEAETEFQNKWSEYVRQGSQRGKLGRPRAGVLLDTSEENHIAAGKGWGVRTVDQLFI